MEEIDYTTAQQWSSLLQRRTMRLLLLYDQGLFRSQFRTFFVESTLPQIPLLQQYDRYLKLLVLSDELLDDIMPRIRRQFSLQTDQASLLEEAPARGDIDWQRTFERSWSDSPGLTPTQFNTRLRQRSTATPENLLTVAVLLAYRKELQRIQSEAFGDEPLSDQERQALIAADERVERELAAAYAHPLLDKAQQAEIETLAEQVIAHLRPGANAYRDLIDWWQKLQHQRIGRGPGQRQLTLASQRNDEQVGTWLYELWIVLELLHLLYEEKALQVSDTSIKRDSLQFTFTWNGRRFRFRYNRQHEKGAKANTDGAWDNAPGSPSSSTVEREKFLEIHHDGVLTWREPPFVMNASYALAGSDPARTYGPIEKLLGGMALLDAQQGALFLPLLPEPADGTHILPATRTIQRKRQRHHAGMLYDLQVHLYRLSPEMELAALQARLRAVLDHIEKHLPERPDPICEGTWLDPDNLNASGKVLTAYNILCPKSHIGAGVFDLVNADLHCLKDPQKCHVFGQSIVRPEVVRVTTPEDLLEKSTSLRTRSDEALRQAEATDAEGHAERLRTQIFTNIGRTVEQYVALRGDTKQIEGMFNNWIFKGYWKEGPRGLALDTRNMLVSGEYVWNWYQEARLEDWAAPAIQYCRALEYEIRRRLYNHQPFAFKLTGAGWTLGVLKTLYYGRNALKGDAAYNWGIASQILIQSGCDRHEFEDILSRLVKSNVFAHRNDLAHGEPIKQQIAETIRETIIGHAGQPGVLRWFAEHLNPA